MRNLYRLLTGYCGWCFGQGLVIPWIVVYLVQVRNLSPLDAGFSLGAMSFGGGVALLFVARWQDHVGHSRMRAFALVVHGMAIAGYFLASGPLMAIVVGALAGAGAASVWNAFSVEMVMSGNERSNAQRFGLAFTLQNLGYGGGSLVSALWIHGGNHIFWPLFVAGAAVCWAWSVFTAMGWRYVTFSGMTPFPASKRSSSNLDMLFPTLVFGLFALMSTAFATLLPLWITGPLTKGTSLVGWANSFSAGSVVVSQVLLGQRRHIKPRLFMVEGSALAYGMAFAIIGLAGTFLRGVWTSFGLFAGMCLVGISEYLLNFSLPGLVNDRAREDRRSRNNAMVNLSWQVGSILGAPLAGAVITQGNWGWIIYVILPWWLAVMGLTAGWRRLKSRF